MAVCVESFSFSGAAQPEAQGPSSLLDDGFLYCLLSPTGLQNYWGPRGPLRLGVAFPTTSYQQHLWYSCLWLPVLTELYNSSTPTQSPTQSLERHVWSSSSGNNSHAVQRSLSSGASVYECIMGFLPCRISSAKSAHVVSFDYWPLECVTSFRRITLEWHVWTGRRSRYNTNWPALFSWDLVWAVVFAWSALSSAFSVFIFFFFCGVLSTPWLYNVKIFSPVIS